MRAAARWATTLIALAAAMIAVLALFLWWQTTRLPYNDEGRYFDAEEGVVHTDDEPPFYGVVGCVALALGGGAGFLRWKLRRPGATGESGGPGL
jgi:uncharacterized iron-regulated membrane protein